jgi:plastocyanin
MNTIPSVLRRSTILTLVAVLALALAACSSGSEEPSAGGSDGGNQGGGTVAVTDGAVTVNAVESLQFDVNTIQATAGEDFTITLVNNDTAPHNITVYTEEGGERIGETGPTAEAGQTVETNVSALEPGTYYFQCDIHPDMNGTIVVEG